MCVYVVVFVRVCVCVRVSVHEGVRDIERERVGGLG